MNHSIASKRSDTRLHIPRAGHEWRLLLSFKAVSYAPMASKKEEATYARGAEMGALVEKVDSAIKFGTIFLSVACVAIFGSIGFLNLYYLPTKIDSMLSAALQEPNKHIATIERQIQRLTSYRNETVPRESFLSVIPAEDQISKLTTHELEKRFSRAVAMVDVSMANRLPAEPGTIQEVSNRVRKTIQRKNVPRNLVAGGQSLLVRFEAYNLFSNDIMSGTPRIVIAPDRPSKITTPLVVGPNPVWISGAGPELSSIKADWPSVVASGATGMPYSLIWFPSGAAHDVLIQDLAVENFAQELASAKWLRVKFVDSVISFNTGSLSLGEVSFSNCKFIFGSSPTAQSVLKEINNAHGKPVNVLVER